MKRFNFDEVVADDRNRLASDIERERADAVHEIVTYQLGELRKAMGLTQTELARLLGMSQPTISKLEGHQQSEKISTLKAYVEALGGRLELSAVFDNYRVVLRGLSDDQDERLATG
jgi:transcriptional regulator with XRE-family HTH domain